MSTFVSICEHRRNMRGTYRDVCRGGGAAFENLGFYWLSLAFLGFLRQGTLAFLGFLRALTLAFVGFFERPTLAFLGFRYATVRA
jgi:hypothetical protein